MQQALVAIKLVAIINLKLALIRRVFGLVGT